MLRSIRNWPRQRKVLGSTLLGTIVIGVIFGIFGIFSTSALFSDSHQGEVDGNLGSIRVAVSGGAGAEGLNFNWENMLPGESKTFTVKYRNVGANAQDVWLTFPNATALSALNDLGTYGEAHVAANGTELFASKNLNDHASCPPGSSSSAHPEPCAALPGQIRIAQNVGPNHHGTVTFTFQYASKLSAQPAAGTTVPFNAYPVSGQTTVRPQDGTGAGLPYAVVATQRGQTP